MWRDLQRICDAMGVPLKRPEPFPQPSLLAARIALALKDEARPNFSRQVYIAEFGEGLPIADRATLAALLTTCGADPEATLLEAESEANKALLKAGCARAAQIGVVGAPCSSPRTARCSGATIGSNRGSIGRRDCVASAQAGLYVYPCSPPLT